MKRDTARGMSMGGVLLAAAIMSVLALGLCRLCVAHLWLSTRSNSQLHASNLANSAASAAIAKVMESKTFGTSDLPDPTVLIESDSGRGVVTFSTERAVQEKIPCSTNNLEGTGPVEGAFGRSVAAGAVHLVAVAWSGGSQRTVEVTLRIPPFPWALLSGGQLHTQGNVLIGALPPGVWPPPPAEELAPADVFANSASSRAVVLDGAGTILGDVESPGRIVRENPEMVVKGEIRSGVKPLEVPRFEATHYDPTTTGVDYDNLSEPLDPTVPLHLVGSVRREQKLTRVAGLSLEGAQLYVDGDLVVDGPIDGNGVIICTGDIKVHNAKMESSSELALLADGRVDIEGGSRSGNTVRGLLYAGKGLKAKDMTVVGTVIVADDGADLQLENVRLLAEAARPIAVSSVRTLYVGDVSAVVPGQPASLAMTRISDDPGSGDYVFSLEIRSNPGPLQSNYTFILSDRFLSLPSVVDANIYFIDSTGQASDLSVLWDSLQSSVGFRISPNNYDRDPNLVSVLDALVSGQLSDLPGSEDQRGGFEWRSELSRFLPFEDRARIVSWFES